MAVDELREITYDKWSDEVWGVMSPSTTTTPTPNVSEQRPRRRNLALATDNDNDSDENDPLLRDQQRSSARAEPSTAAPVKIRLYFVQNDHWIADTTRDAIIKSRCTEGGEEGNTASAYIEEKKVSHGWCIREFTAIHLISFSRFSLSRFQCRLFLARFPNHVSLGSRLCAVSCFQYCD